MTRGARVEQIGEDGLARGKSAVCEAATGMEAITVATDEVDIGRSGPQRAATVLNASGALVLAYAGHARAARRSPR